MIIPDNIVEPVTLKDRFFDLKGLEVYCSLKVPTLRDHIRSGDLPAFKVKGKILIKKSEFDHWIESFRLNKRQNINRLIDGVMGDLKGV